MKNSSPRTRFNRRVLAITLILAILSLLFFAFGMYCLLSNTVPTAGFISEKFMKAFIGYCVYRGLTNVAMFMSIFVFYFRVHNIDDLITQPGSYELRYLGVAFIAIWAINLVLTFFIPNFLMPPHGLVFLGVLCVLLSTMIFLLANKVDMYLNCEGGNRKIGDMSPVQFLDFIASLFKKS